MGKKMIELGRAVKEFRTKRRLSQRELAAGATMSISAPYVGQIENGKTDHVSDVRISILDHALRANGKLFAAAAKDRGVDPTARAISDVGARRIREIVGRMIAVEQLEGDDSSLLSGTSEERRAAKVEMLRQICAALPD